jgi:O-antigen/teichoic acid export membrane protein
MGRVSFNAASQLIALGAVLGLQTIYLFFVARHLGPTDFGWFSFSWSIVQVLLVVGDLGLHNTAIREISADPAESFRSSEQLLWLKLRLSLALAAFPLLLGFAMGMQPGVHLALAVFGIGMLFQSLSIAINILFQANGRLYLASLNIALLFAVQFVLGLTLIALGGGLAALAAAYAVAAFVALCCNLFLFRRLVHPLNWTRPPSDWKGCLRSSLPVGLSNIFQAAGSRLTIWLLVFLVTPAEAGVFAAAFRLPAALNNVPLGVLGAVLPVFASHQADPKAIRPLVAKALVVLEVFAVVVGALLGLLAGPLIAFIYGPQYTSSVACLRILAWCLVPSFSSLVFQHILLSQNRLVVLLPWLTGGGVLLSLGLCLWLVPEMGARGASWAVLLTELGLTTAYAFLGGRFLLGRLWIGDRETVT